MTELPGHDMVPVRGDQLPTQADVGELAQAHLEAMKWREEIIGQRIPAILKRTSPKHWIDYGGEADPRPEDEAAVIFATMLGISYRWLPQPDGKNYFERAIDGNPGNYEVMVEIEGSGFGRTVQEVGSCRSDDGFLSSGKRKAAPGRAIWSDVKKKAMANAIVRLLQALGMRGITWEDLEKAGIKRDACQRVSFAEGESVAGKRAQQAQVNKPCPKCAEAACEKCQSTGKPGMLTLRSGAKGNFLGCSHYPACRHTEQPSAAPAEPEAPAAATTTDNPPTEPTERQVTIEEITRMREALFVGENVRDQWTAFLGANFAGATELRDLSDEQIAECRIILAERTAKADPFSGQ